MAIPLRGGINGTVEADGVTNPALESQLVETNGITPDFFSAYHIPLIAGRTFTADDIERTAVMNLRADALTPEQAAHPPADLVFQGVINQQMAKMFWPNQDPLGKVVRAFGAVVQVVGVVGDVKEWADLRSKPLPEIYMPYTIYLDNTSSLYITAKTKVPPSQLAAPIRAEMGKLDSHLALFHVRTMDGIIAESMRDMTLQTVLLASFAGLALVLAAIGIYGVMSYAVSQREHEFGIRMALGAPRSSVSRMVVSRGLRLAGVGVLTGVVLAIALAKLMTALVFGVSVWDPISFAAAAGTLLVIAALACYIPARRAMSVDPMIALRHE